MKRKIISAIAVIMALSCFTGCGQDKEKLQELNTRLTKMETEMNSIYGKVEDLYSSKALSEKIYNDFMDTDKALEEVMEKAESKNPDIDTLESDVNSLEEKVTTVVDSVEKAVEKNQNTLDREIVELKMICDELGEIMERALSQGNITQERMDEFTQLKNQVDLLDSLEQTYNDDIKNQIKDIRSKLGAMASQVKADNSLIDRIVDADEQFVYNKDENQEGTTEAAVGNAGAENTPETTAAAEKKPLSEDADTLITNYLALQDFAVEAVKEEKLEESVLKDIMACGVQLTYLKEGMEKDGVTENNTERTKSIKKSLYDLAVKAEYPQAELFAE